MFEEQHGYFRPYFQLLSLHCEKITALQRNWSQEKTSIRSVYCCLHLTMGTTGPEFMYLTRSLKKGFALKAA